MATWSTPPTFISGETTAALTKMQQVSDDIAVLATWLDYTPTVGGLTIGNGTVAGRYIKASGRVDFHALVTLGSTSSVTGVLSITTPTNPTVATEPYAWPAVCVIGSGYYTGRMVQLAAGNNRLLVPGTTAGGSDRSATTGVPAAWATGSLIQVFGSYESA